MGLGKGPAKLGELGDRLKRPRPQDIGADHHSDVKFTDHHKGCADTNNGDAHEARCALGNGLSQSLTGADIPT